MFLTLKHYGVQAKKAVTWTHRFLCLLSLITICCSDHLVLTDLTQDKVPELLRLVAEHQDPAIFADDPQHLLTHMDHQLGLDDGVIASGDH